MNLDSEKLKIINWIASLSDESIIYKIKLLREQEKNTDWWDEISEAEKASIKRGLEDAKAGRVVPHEEVRKKYEQYL
jgi:predicted transcriptional regulator